MAKPLYLQKSLSGLLTLALTFTVVAPGVWLANTPRAAAATYTVNSNNDVDDTTCDGTHCSLREAIDDANANPGADTISIDATLSGTTITVGSELPIISGDTTIDGSAPASPVIITAGAQDYALCFSAGTSTVKGLRFTGDTFLGSIRITGGTVTVGGTGTREEVNIQGAISGGSGGILITAGTLTVVNSTLTGNYAGVRTSGTPTAITIGGATSSYRNIINANQVGITLDPSAALSSVTIQNNYIGTNAAGDADSGNSGSGIYLGVNVSGAVVQSNVISGNNAHGIFLDSASTTVKGNYIGTNAAGTGDLGNSSNGIIIHSSTNTIGGDSSAERNIISGNDLAGILLDASSSTVTNNSIKSNYIGLGSDGTTAVGNTTSGIYIMGGATNTTIGGTSSNGNVISSNTSHGINIAGVTSTGTTIYGNIIGLSADGTTNKGNGGSGIVVAGDTTTIGSSTSGARNTISANTAYGVYINGADSVSVKGNYIGTKSDGTSSSNTNTEDAILIDSTGASNTIGGTVSGEANVIETALTKIGVNIASTAGNYNNIRKNSAASSSGFGANYIVRNGTANESLTTPTVTFATQNGTTTTHIYGAAPASSTVDIHVAGIYNTSVTADSSGYYSTTITATSGTVVVTAINASGSTSSSSTGLAITAGPLTLTTPTLSYSATGTSGAASTISISGAQAYADIYVNNIDTGNDTDIGGTGSTNQTLIDGTNVFQVKIVDGYNSSGIATATITANSSSGSQGSGTSIPAGAAGSGGTRAEEEEEEPLESDVTDDSTESMAGDEEVVDPSEEEDAPVEEANTDTQENTTEEEPAPTTNNSTSATSNTSSSSTATSSSSSSNTSKPTKSFYSGIYEYVTPIKPVSIRDTMPERPAGTKIYHYNLYDSRVLGAKPAGGIPEKLLKIKLGNLTLSGDEDNDGLLNVEEFEYGSNPFVKDSDADGITDFQEIMFDGTDPSSWDSDHDWIRDREDAEPLENNDIRDLLPLKTLTNYIEENTITQPLGTVDTDSDGLCDKLELIIGTDPKDSDTDNDGLNDGEEGLHYGTDPSNPSDPVVSTSSTGGGMAIHITNTDAEETVAEGEQFFMGSADPESTVGIYTVSENGTLSLLGETQSDENGRFNIYTDVALEAGTYTLVGIQGSLNAVEDFTRTYQMTVLDWVKRPEYVSLALKNNSSITDHRPLVDLLVADRYLVVVSWRSTVYSQVLIADSSDQVIYTRPNADLDVGAHTVTWYAEDPSSGNKSNPTRVAFNVTNEAFLSGQEATSPWNLILGSIAVLASLAALGLYFRKKN